MSDVAAPMNDQGDPDHDPFDDDLMADEQQDFDLAEGESRVPPSSMPARYALPGGDGLTQSDANELLNTVSGTVVLIAGEVNAGKTTLLVEIYAQFLEGSVGGKKYAGSLTLSGFHRRHATARASSGASIPGTERTQDDQLRHLHLALSEAGKRWDLVVSDLRGEVFELVIDGRRASIEIPFIQRVDKCLVLLDGEQMSRASTRALQIFRAEQLVDGLTETDSLRDGVSLAFVCTKADMIDGGELRHVEDALGDLRSRVKRASIESSVLMLSARPADGSRASGLGEVLDFLCRPVYRAPLTISVPEAQGRHFWRGAH